MKKSLIILSLLIFSFSLMAQKETLQPDSIKYTYCQIGILIKPMSIKRTISLEFPEESIFYNDARYIDQTTGKWYQFKNEIAAFEFLGNKGWKLILKTEDIVGTIPVNYYTFMKQLK